MPKERDCKRNLIDPGVFLAGLCELCAKPFLFNRYVARNPPIRSLVLHLPESAPRKYLSRKSSIAL